MSNDTDAALDYARAALDGLSDVLPERVVEDVLNQARRDVPGGEEAFLRLLRAAEERMRFSKLCGRN